jgi:hypothetical protein
MAFDVVSMPPTTGSGCVSNTGSSPRNNDSSATIGRAFVAPR